MTNHPDLRAADDDRDRVIAQLQEHHAVGRLTPAEFQERVDRALETKTLGELAELTSDLPALEPAEPEKPNLDRPSRFSPEWRNAWAGWASVSMVCFVIWLITAINSGSPAGLWFLWVAGPWGGILLARWIFGANPEDKKDKDKVEDGERKQRPELGGNGTG